MHILLLEDDSQLNLILKRYLVHKKYKVESCFDANEVKKALACRLFDAYVLDINVPKGSGVDLIKTIRTLDKEAKIIMITANNEIGAFTKSYENGCNDYIRKPFNPLELTTRLHAMIPKKDTFCITKECFYKYKEQALYINDKKVILSYKSNRLLELLVDNANTVVTVERIQEYVWEGEVKQTYRVRQLIAELNKQLGEDRIQNIQKQGYILNANKA